jgi:plasmid stabilization system protein ParE
VRVTFRQAAQTDLIRQFRYYLVTLGLPHVALRFKEAVKSTAREIGNYPKVAAPCHLRNPSFSACVPGLWTDSKRYGFTSLQSKEQCA